MPHAQDREIPENVPFRPSFPPLAPIRPLGRTFRTFKLLGGLFLVSLLLSIFSLSSLLALLFGGLTLFLLVAVVSFLILRFLWFSLRRLWQ
jgi:hypothetical protein